MKKEKTKTKRKKKEPKKYWHSNYCFYETDTEKRAAKRYLKLWKQFFMKKFPKALVFHEEKWVINDKSKSVALKFCFIRKRKGKKPPRGLKKIGTTTLWYDDIPYDKDGWADAKRYAPDNFDMVTIKTDKKTLNGWYTGDEWYSLRLRPKDDVLLWQKKNELY